MKIDFARALTDLGGAPLKTADGIDMTLGVAAVHVLLMPLKGEPEIDGLEKLRRWNLAKKAHEQAETTLAVEDVALIKRLIAKGFDPLIAGQCWEIIEAHPAE